MFNQRPDTVAPAVRGSAKPTFSVLAGDIVFTGNIAAATDLHIDGRVDGDIACAALVQGADSVIRGTVTARTARIAGTVDGSVVAEELIAEPTARITGDCSYQVLTVQPGASIAGKLIHNALEAPALKVVASAD